MRHRPATCDGCGKPLWRDYLSTAGLDICCCLKSSKTLPQMYDERVEEISRLRAELADCRALLAVYGDRAEELRESCEEKQRCIDSSVQAQRTFLAEIGHLRAELAEYKQDAERYRWIRIAQNLDRVYELDGEVLDQMIDAARKGEGEE